jgi:cytochrome oxidase Cu insertion factor (SCO1/SenC/PrrC family)
MRVYPLLLIACLFAASPSDISAQSSGESPPNSAGKATPASIGGRFILVDQNGKTVLDENYRGSFLLITFGYTHCPDICPTTLANMAGALDILGPDAVKVQPIFITLDPGRDTPAVLKDYVGSFGARFAGLTGPEAYIADAAAKYRIKYNKVESASAGYTIDHTVGIFLMGPDGEFVARFPHDLSAGALAERLRERLSTGAK